VSESDSPTERAERAIGRGRELLDGAYLRADQLLDHGQTRALRFLWFFLPETSIARRPRLQQVLVSRFLSDAGQQSLAYGALIAVVQGGGSALDAALIGVAALLPPAALGLYGGAIADALPKRVALAMAYNLQALLCFLAPTLLGTDLAALMALIFAVNVLGQVSGPTESAVLPLLVTDAQMATAASLIGLASSLGSAFGTALLAPVLVRAFGVEPVIYLAGVLLLLAASRVFDLPTGEPEPDEKSPLVILRPQVRVRAAIDWLTRQPAVATMMVVAVIAGTAQIVIQTLAPRYVQAVLHVEAADAVYVFAPSAAGLALALVLAPRLISALGERTCSLVGFCFVTAVLVLLGLVGPVRDAIDPVNPARLLSLAGITMEDRLRTAALLALPLGFGIALTSTSVQTYINRRVPHGFQGRAFALQSSLKNGAAIVPLLTLGAAASAFGVESVLIAAPFVLLAVAYGLIQLSRYFGGQAPSFGIDVLASFWEEPAPEAFVKPQ